MEVTRIEDAQPYETARHHGVAALRLQGHDATAASTAWIGLSHFLPGGGADLSTSALERMYVVVDGQLCVTTADGEVTLRPFDSCRIGPGEIRSVRNHTNLPASMLVIMPYPTETGTGSLPV